MNPLAELIREEIRREGAIGFDRFMDLALYHPDHGYYRQTRERPRTGREGDFFTSVSVGPLFGRLLARQFLEMWERLERPSSFCLTEQGGEDAQLACDILEWCRAEAADFYHALSYILIEEHPDTRAGQEQQLGLQDFLKKVSWRSLEERTKNPSVGVFFSNELVDAFPVRVITRKDGRWLERRIALNTHDEFAWREASIDDLSLSAAIEALPLPEMEGYTTEINLRAYAWMEQVARSVERGYVLTIDYGFPAGLYYAAFRKSGTLTAYRNHRRLDHVLADPGRADLTAHVDFTALAREGERAGLATIGFVDQQRFLMGIGRQEIAGGPGSKTGISQNVPAWQTLIHPHYLGAKFQVLLQARNVSSELDGLHYARPGDLGSLRTR